MDDPTDLYKTTRIVIRQVYYSALIFTSVKTSGLVGSSTPDTALSLFTRSY